MRPGGLLTPLSEGRSRLDSQIWGVVGFSCPSSWGGQPSQLRALRKTWQVEGAPKPSIAVNQGDFMVTSTTFTSDGPPRLVFLGDIFAL